MTFLITHTVAVPAEVRICEDNATATGAQWPVSNVANAQARPASA